MKSFVLHLVVHGDLGWFLARRNQKADLHLMRDRRASIKDTIEALGLPHTEVGTILCDGTPVDFSRVPTEDCRIDVYPVIPPLDVTRPTLLRPEPLAAVRFLVDDNVGKLAGLLRAVGLDTEKADGTPDEALADLCADQGLILLSRDLELLKRKKVRFGRYIRETRPYRQLSEVLTVFGLHGPYAFFSRCFLCNRPLVSIPKEAVLHRLQPETRQHVTRLSTCPSCHRLFWYGPHGKRMLSKMAEAGIDVSSAGPSLGP